MTTETSINVATMRLDGDPTVETLLDNGFINANGHLSPDGRWLAYASDASGEYEVYVRPFPDVDAGRWQISSGGGDTPLWMPGGRELIFWSRKNALMRVAIDTRNGFNPGIPEPFLESPYYYFTDFYRTFDVAPDGERFLMLKEGGASDADTHPRPDPRRHRPKLVRGVETPRADRLTHVPYESGSRLGPYEVVDAHRRGGHGRGLPRAGHQARPRGCVQNPRAGDGESQAPSRPMSSRLVASSTRLRNPSSLSSDSIERILAARLSGTSPNF